MPVGAIRLANKRILVDCCLTVTPCAETWVGSCASAIATRW